MMPPKKEQIAARTIAALQSIYAWTVKHWWHHMVFGLFLEDAEETFVCLQPLLWK